METLKLLRLRSHETQNQIAAVLGITRAAYTNIENDKRGCDSDALKTLARHFDVSVDYILGLTENEKPPRAASPCSPEELELIRKYRRLSEHGKRVVDLILEEEAEYADATDQQTMIAARGGGVEERTISKEEADRLLQLPEVEEF